MSRYRGPKLKIIRRLGELPGLTRKNLSTNSKSNRSTLKKKKLSQYAIQLQEKQKLRFNYGLTELQLVKYVKTARKLKGATGEVLLQLLEMRLDNILFRFGLTPTIASARQLINHGHILVNNKKVTIPSYQCEIKDIISISKKQNSRDLAENLFKISDSQTVPSHLNFNSTNFTGEITHIANRQSVNLTLDELLIVEYYSRKF